MPAAADFEAVCERELAAVLLYVGPHQHLYICVVNRALHAQYHKVKDENGGVHCKTSYRAVFESVSRLTLAVQCGLMLNHQQYRAGRYASIEVLQAARALGLFFTSHVVRGAAHSRSLLKLRWLVEDRKALPGCGIGEEIAETGSVEMMQWLQSKSVPITSEALRVAAGGNHLPLIEYLRSIGTSWHADTAAGVAKKGHLDMPKWLHSHQCPMDLDRLAFCAARGAHVTILEWLLIEQDINLSATRALAGAAAGGHLSLMRDHDRTGMCCHC